MRNQPRKEIHGAEFRKVPNKDLLFILSLCSLGQWYSSEVICDDTHGVLPTRQVHLRLVSLVVIGFHCELDCLSV